MWYGYEPKATISAAVPFPGSANQKTITSCFATEKYPGISCPYFASMCVCLSPDFVTNLSHPTDHEPSDDSSPTETCVCVHCFPDLKALGQGNDRPPKAPFSFYPQPVLHRAQIQKGGPHQTEGNFLTPGREVQEEAAVGY